MTIFKNFLVVFLIFAAAVYCSQKKDDSKISIEVSNNKLNVYFEGKLRLEGGRFILQSKNIRVEKVSGENGVFSFQTNKEPVKISVKSEKQSPVACFFLSPGENESKNGKNFLGMFFEKMPGYKNGTMLWRYGPWYSWSKPLPVKKVSQLKSSDIQFFYWQYDDGLYGAAMPLSGQGYRTTLGSEGPFFGSKSVSYFNNMDKENIPQMAVGFGKDPYRLFETLYKEGLAAIGKEADFLNNKTFPKIFDGIGWCSWNASNEGKNLNDSLLIKSAESYAKAKFPVKWFLIDDGWFDVTDSKLNSFRPDKKKFPNGFAPVIEKLKKDYGINDVGIWSTLNGYWNGINPESELGKEYKDELFSWKQKVRPDLAKSKTTTCYFIRPGSESLNKFYDDFYGYLRDQGCSFVKIDNQLVTQRMAVNNFPIFSGSEKYHEAINSAVARYFNNTIINCMDMTPEAYLNFGSTAVARAEDDYYPAYNKKQSDSFVMERAYKHIIQETFNSLYFSQMVYPDFDMFESISPSAVLYAFTHAMNNGPIYITDKVNEHNFKVLWPLVYSNGNILRADKPLVPTEDCLFDFNGVKPFKAFSTVGDAGLLTVIKVSEKGEKFGFFKPSDVHYLKAVQYAVYEYFTKQFLIADRDQKILCELNDLPFKLYILVPMSHGSAVFGLVNKYNAPASILSSEISLNEIKATVYEGGDFAAIIRKRPAKVEVDGKEHPFTYDRGILKINIPVTGNSNHVNIDIIL